MTSVLILGGGPDAEREISIDSAAAIYQGCLDAGFDATLLIVDRPDLDEVESWDADVVFPALHGRFGEGGGLQVLLEEAGVAYIGCRAPAARLAMDKLGTKLIASRCSIATPAACVFDPADCDCPTQAICPFDLPVVIKPVADGSSVGLHMCHTLADWHEAVARVGDDLGINPHRVYMVERLMDGREMTVSVVSSGPDEFRALPIIEISPAAGVYDFEAKYARNDTVYTPNPELADGLAGQIQGQALELCMALGVRHLARVDFMICEDTHCGVLEVNTMPGFTKSSLMPMAAAADGMSMGDLCGHLVRCAIEDHAQTKSEIPTV